VPRVVFVQPDGVRRPIDVPAGITLMEAARQNGVAGIVAQCGGACACATCHVYVDRSWLSRLDPPEDMEEGMLETAWEPRDNSRLSCQVHVTATLDGLEVTVPEKQQGC
jgi:ferredoxin, 2Fe-2S